MGIRNSILKDVSVKLVDITTGINRDTNSMHGSGTLRLFLIKEVIVKTLNLELDINNNQHRILSGGEVNLMICPFCNDEKWHLYANTNKRVFVCHKCGTKGRLVSEDRKSLTDWKRVRFEVKYWEFGELYAASPSTIKKAIEQEKLIKNLPHCSELVPKVFDNGGALYLTSKAASEARHYLYSRGLTKEEIHRYKISLSLEKSGPYVNRIIFPIYYRSTSNPQYFIARTFYDGDNRPKYINAPWPKGETIFVTGDNRDKQIVICEGILDAIAIARFGYTAVALLGKQISIEQLKLFPLNVLICLDADAWEHACMIKMQHMEYFPRRKSEIINLYGADPASMAMNDPDALKRSLHEATERLKRN